MEIGIIVLLGTVVIAGFPLLMDRLVRSLGPPHFRTEPPEIQRIYDGIMAFTFLAFAVGFAWMFANSILFGLALGWLIPAVVFVSRLQGRVKSAMMALTVISLTLIGLAIATP